jgi:hypothetical protein
MAGVTLAENRICQPVAVTIPCLSAIRILLPASSNRATTHECPPAAERAGHRF